MTDPLRGNMQPHHSSGVKYDPTHKYFSRIEKRPTNRFIRATHDPVSGASNKSGKNLLSTPEDLRRYHQTGASEKVERMFQNICHTGAVSRKYREEIYIYMKEEGRQHMLELLHIKWEITPFLLYSHNVTHAHIPQ